MWALAAKAEAAKQQDGSFTAMVLWDLKQFYERVDRERLTQRARRTTSGKAWRPSASQRRVIRIKGCCLWKGWRSCVGTRVLASLMAALSPRRRYTFTCLEPVSALVAAKAFYTILVRVSGRLHDAYHQAHKKARHQNDTMKAASLMND